MKLCIVCSVLFFITVIPVNAESSRGKNKRFPTPAPTSQPAPTQSPTEMSKPTVKFVIRATPTSTATPSEIPTGEPILTTEVVFLDGIQNYHPPFIRFVWPNIRWWFLTPLTHFLGYILGWA